VNDGDPAERRVLQVVHRHPREPVVIFGDFLVFEQKKQIMLLPKSERENMGKKSYLYKNYPPHKSGSA
jgi:hypothetical protein